MATLFNVCKEWDDRARCIVLTCRDLEQVGRNKKDCTRAVLHCCSSKQLAMIVNMPASKHKDLLCASLSGNDSRERVATCSAQPAAC